MSRFLTTAPLLAMSLLVLSAAGPLSEQEVRQTGESIVQAYKKASQAKDAAALAAAYTEDAILVVPEGPLVGRAAIERYFNNAFKVFTLEAAQLDRVSMIADGRVMLRVVGFTGTVKRSNGMAPVKGHWATTDIREGGKWKTRLEEDNMITLSAPSHG